jgi:E3 ubiquitin-protein ligase HECTD3
MVVMGGESFGNLRKLNDVTVDHTIEGLHDVVVLADQTEHYPFIEIRIKECQDGGIDARVHGIKVKSSKEKEMGLNRDLLENKDVLIRYPRLEEFDVDVLYRKALVLLRLMKLVDSVLPFIVPKWEYSLASHGSVEIIRELLPLSKKRVRLVDQFLCESESVAPSSAKKVYIDRRAAMEHRCDPSIDPDCRNSVFCQLFEGLKPRESGQKPLDYRWPTRYHQWWECKFIGEGIVDQGGGFRDSLSDLAEELCPSSSDCPLPLPFFIRTPNQTNIDASNYRDLYIPNPSCTQYHKYEWIGKLMGACFRSKENLVLCLSPFFWKTLCGQPVSWSRDFMTVDEAQVKLIESMRVMSEEAFRAYFSDELMWTTALSDGTVAHLKPASLSSSSNDDISSSSSLSRVRYENRHEYASLVEQTRMNESRTQIDAILRGLLQVIPQATLQLYTWQEVEKRICGDPEITLESLRPHILLEDLSREDTRIKYLWEVLEKFSNEDRSRFLRFVSGRRRLPATVHVLAGDGTDVLPTASTCGSAIILPNYTSAKVMEEKLRYAAYNCIAIDTDIGPYNNNYYDD